MKFNGHISQATLLKRSMNFLAEAVVINKQKIMLRCPDLNLPHNCDLLGTKIWYSDPIDDHCLPTWELVEVDGGALVCINPELTSTLFMEAIANATITELCDFTITHAITPYRQCYPQNIWLADNNSNMCFINLENSIIGDDHGNGYFPTPANMHLENIKRVITALDEGHKAVMFYCVMHTGISNLKLHNNLNTEYKSLFHEAMQKGAEILAYKVIISYQGVEIFTPIPVLLPKATNSK